MGRITCEHPRAPGGPVRFAISERNALALLVELHTPGSAKTVVVCDVPDGWQPVELVIEDDAEHYDSPTRWGDPAGPMHPLTELVMFVIRELLEGDLAADVCPEVLL